MKLDDLNRVSALSRQLVELETAQLRFDNDDVKVYVGTFRMELNELPTIRPAINNYLIKKINNVKDELASLGVTL